MSHGEGTARGDRDRVPWAERVVGPRGQRPAEDAGGQSSRPKPAPGGGDPGHAGRRPRAGERNRAPTVPAHIRHYRETSANGTEWEPAAGGPALPSSASRISIGENALPSQVDCPFSVPDGTTGALVPATRPSQARRPVPALLGGITGSPPLPVACPGHRAPSFDGSAPLRRNPRSLGGPDCPESIAGRPQASHNSAGTWNRIRG
ncbi:hypothetical protein Rumeso_02723 [Rubellimicrobium mesophilum DSM 19309]|uniref:Uncharacterized protein n=1 Tax=Rubellimicrobium mesophilum DSM 19309 TaxID=442562 RepID=A0A017HMP6_9RHOB|nr:hypothetical protein Rumeso_02723 [Rubellimicrobium mesophilum DSM 19309]